MTIASLRRAAAGSLLLLPCFAAHAVEYKADVVRTPLLKTETTYAGQPIVYPKTDHPEVQAFRVELPPGKETGWHKHPVPCYTYILSGTIVVDMEGGVSKTFHAGDAVVESVDKPHNGRNEGTEPVKMIMFVTGEKGTPISVQVAHP
jgi:quercetin dioxygenase-like cupin family protein